VKYSEYVQYLVDVTTSGYVARVGNETIAVGLKNDVAKYLKFLVDNGRVNIANVKVTPR
jgi:hypothetical protein